MANTVYIRATRQDDNSILARWKIRGLEYSMVFDTPQHVHDYFCGLYDNFRIEPVFMA